LLGSLSQRSDETNGEGGYSECPAKALLSRQMRAAAGAASTHLSSAPSLALGSKRQVLKLSRTKGRGWPQAPQFSGKRTVHKRTAKLF